MTPLMLAAARQQLAIVKEILMAENLIQANLSLRNLAGDTAAHIAASRGDIKIVEALHRAGANLHLYNNPQRAQAGFRPSEVARRKGYLESTATTGRSRRQASGQDSRLITNTSPFSTSPQSSSPSPNAAALNNQISAPSSSLFFASSPAHPETGSQSREVGRAVGQEAEHGGGPVESSNYQGSRSRDDDEIDYVTVGGRATRGVSDKGNRGRSGKSNGISTTTVTSKVDSDHGLNTQGDGEGGKSNGENGPRAHSRINKSLTNRTYSANGSNGNAHDEQREELERREREERADALSLVSETRHAVQDLKSQMEDVLLELQSLDRMKVELEREQRGKEIGQRKLLLAVTLERAEAEESNLAVLCDTVAQAEERCRAALEEAERVRRESQERLRSAQERVKRVREEASRRAGETQEVERAMVGSGPGSTSGGGGKKEESVTVVGWVETVVVFMLGGVQRGEEGVRETLRGGGPRVAVQGVQATEVGGIHASLEHAQGATGAISGPGAREENGTELEGEGEDRNEDVESGIVGGDERHGDVPTVSEPSEGPLDVEEGERVRRFADWKESVAALKHSPYRDDHEGDGEDDSGPSESLNYNNKSINNYNDGSGDGSHASNNSIFRRMVMKSDVQKRNDNNVAVATNSRNTNSSNKNTSTPPAPPATTTSSIRMSMSVASHRTQSAGRVPAREAYTLSRGRGRNDGQDDEEPFQREESPRKGRRRAPPPPVEASVPRHSNLTQADGQDYSGQQQARRKVIPVTVSGSGQPQVQFQLPDEPPVNRRPSSASARSSSKDDNRNTMGRSPGSRAPVSRASVSSLPGRGSKKGQGEGEGPGSKYGVTGRSGPSRPAAGQGKYAMTVSGNHSMDAVGGGRQGNRHVGGEDDDVEDEGGVTPERRRDLNESSEGTEVAEEDFDIEEIVGKDPQETLMLRAVALEKRGDVAGAFKHLRQILANDKANVQATLSLGRLLLSAGELQSAEMLYRRAVSLGTGGVEAHLGLASVYGRMPGKAEPEILCLRGASRLWPEDVGVRVALGKALNRDRRYPEAAHEFKAAITRDGHCTEAVTALAHTLMQLGRSEDAVKCIEMSALIGREREDALLELGEALLERHEARVTAEGNGEVSASERGEVELRSAERCFELALFSKDDELELDDEAQIEEQGSGHRVNILQLYFLSVHHGGMPSSALYTVQLTYFCMTISSIGVVGSCV
eukprot:gene924-1035_t